MSPGYPRLMHRSESDISDDPHVAQSREVGGRDEHDEPDRADRDGTATTGVRRNEEFVGRVTGEDAGDTGTTGAEERAER
jgi:hypothetical protein